MRFFIDKNVVCLTQNLAKYNGSNNNEKFTVAYVA